LICRHFFALGITWTTRFTAERFISPAHWPAKSGAGAAMTHNWSRLPNRFPVGTKFVIEGRSARDGEQQIFTRYLEFPDGTFFPLPSRTVRKAAPVKRYRVRPAVIAGSKKKGPAKGPSGGM
jgi:hypothetical protein